MSDNLGFEGFTKIDTPKEQPNSEMSFEAEGFKSLSKIQPTEQDSLKSIIQMSLPGGDQEEIAATIGLVNKFSGIYGTDINDTLNSLDSMVADYFQQTIPRKDAFRAIQDEFKISRANNEIAFLTNRALNTNDEAERAKLFEQVKEVEKFMPSPDMVNRGIGTKFMKAAASLTGSTLDSLIVGGAVGAMAAPVLAAMGASSVIASLTPTMQKITMMAANTLAQSGATFVTSTALERGSIAKDMLDNGIDIETVKKVSATYGMIAGAIETAGIEVMLSRFPGLKQLTQKAFMTTAIKERAKQGIAKGIMQIAKDNLIQIPVSILAETTTETLQTLVEIKAQEVGRALDDEVSKWNRTRDRADGDYIPEEYKEQVKQQLIETAKQTAMGMAVMGGVGAGVNIAIDTRQNAQQTGKYTLQQKKVAEIKKGMAEKQSATTEAIKAQESARAAFNENPTDENLASLQKADEVVQKMNIQAEPADDMLLLEAERQELLADTPSVENIARLNAISESMEMMQRKEIPVSAEKQIWQMTAEEYEQSLQNDAKVMAEGVMDTETAINENRFRDKIKSITPNALPEAEIDAIITLFKTQAANTGVDFETYLNTTFDSQIAVTGYQAGVLSQKHKGAVIFKQGKALVVLGKKADFSTWVHEAGHIFRQQLNTDLMTRAESYYGVQGNKWTVPQEEAFTEDLTTYLMTGQAPTAELRNVFQIIADALIAIYKSLSNRGEISPEIKAVFDEMFQTESSILFQAELYHGSPHSFDEFSTEHIGTGEGAQAFGWGLYFTEDEGIAESYRKKLSTQKPYIIFPYGDENKYTFYDNESGLLDESSEGLDYDNIIAARILYFNDINGFENAILEAEKQNDKVLYRNETYEIDEAKKGLALAQSDEIEIGYDKGVLYTVTPSEKADFDEMTWLDWDKPISEENKNKLQQSLSEIPEGKAKDRILSYLKSPDWSPHTGQEYYQILVDAFDKGSAGQRDASLLLNRAGIDGIRYPANFLSGGNADGKSNYVVFDENAVQVKERILFQSESIKAELLQPEVQQEIQTRIAEVEQSIQERINNPKKDRWDKAAKKAADRLLAILESFKQGNNYFENIDKHFAILHKSTKGITKWQMSYFDNRGAYTDQQSDFVAKGWDSIANNLENNGFFPADYKQNKILFQSETAEIETVRQKYEGTDKWMKAPNGQPTKLNERQWLQVRTPAFKAWFGDWENDTANASKVVDENGEPMVVYHGTDAKFDQFIKTKNGLWFTPDKQSAESYALKRTNNAAENIVYPVFLNTKNPAKREYYNPSNIDNEMWTDGTKRFNELGHDGWISKYDDGNIFTIVVNNPTQIKSATANTGAFDGSNPKILFQSEITPEQQKAFDSAVTAHGLTNDINEAGYVLPDGKMLDFSGRFNSTGYKKQGDKFIAEKDDYLKNNRPVDHRDILYTDRANNGNEAMQNFISMGAIRIDADAGVVDMATLPTAQQYKVIQRVIENAGGATVEINYNGNSVNFDSEATPAKIIGQIKQFFKTGVINERMLFQSENPAHKDAVERAVEQGLYVPDEVISQYISEQWAQEEMQERTEFGRDALEFINKPNGAEEYIEFGIAFSDKPRSYFKAIWDNLQPAKVMTRDQSNKAFVSSLDKDTLTGYLKAYRYAERQIAFPDTFMQNSYYGLLKNRHELTAGEYKQLMVKIKADPQTYREFFATVFEDDAALAQLQRERELFPDATALEKLRAENKRLRKENKDYNKSVEQLKQSASLFAGQRDYARMQGIYLTDALDSAKSESLAGEKAVKAELTDVIKDARAESTAQVKAVKADAKLQMKKERILNAFEKIKLKSDLLEGFKQYKENKKQIALMEKLIKQIMKKPSAMVERSYADRIEAIQAKYRAQRTSPQRMEFIEWAKNQMLTADDKTKAELQKEISKVSLKDLTIDELMKIADEVRELALAGFTVRQNYLMDQKIMRGETADKIVQENKTDKTTGTFGTVGTGDEKKGSIYKNIAATWFDMRRLSKILGKTSEEFLTDKVHEARNEEIRNQLRRKKAVVDKMKELNITPAKLAKKVIFESDTRPINRNSILGFYIAMQNDDTLAKIYYGNLKNNPMRDRFLEEVNENISAEEIAFANWMMDSLSGEDRDRFFDAVLEDTNTRPEAVARYFPAFVADSNTDTHELNKELAQEVLNRSPYGKAYPSKKNAISRLKNISPEHQSEMRVDALGVYFEIIDRSEHFIAFGKLIKDLQAIYNKKEVKEAIALKHGKQFNNTIQTYLNITANPAAYRNQIAQTKFFGSMVSNSIVAPLLFNIPSVLKNVTGFFLYMRESSLAEMAAAQAEIAVNYNKVKSFVYENSPKVEDRAIDDYLQKLDYSLNNPEIGRRAVKEIQKIGLTPLTLMDSYTVIVGWYAVYKTEMKRSGDHEAAVKLADDVFLKTQPQGRPEDSPIVYQDKTLRPFLAFTRQTNQIFQMIAADTPQHLREGKYRQFVYDMVAISMTAIIIGMITRRRPQEDEEELLKDLVAQFAVSLPLVGGTLSNMIQGSFYADRGFNLPIASTVAQAYRTAETAFDEYGTSEEMIDEGIRLATEAMKVYGLPSVLTQRAFKAWEEEDLRYVLIGGIPQE